MGEILLEFREIAFIYTYINKTSLKIIDIFLITLIYFKV